MDKKEHRALLGLYSIDRVQEINLGALISERSNRDWEVLGLYLPNIVQFSAINQNFVINYILANAERPEKITGVHSITPIRTTK